MDFADKALADDMVGGFNMSVACMAHTCRGRVLASSSRNAAAVAAFEDAVSTARSRDYIWLEVCALFDLVERVEATPDEKRDRASRLDFALDRLVASRSEAEELLRSRFIGWAPECIFLPTAISSGFSSGGSESAALKALRAELATLKATELRRRAAAAGVEQEEIDDADDALNPKEALIVLIIEAETPAKAAAADGERVQREAALREELAALRVSELRRRAAAAGVGEDEIDGADDALNPKQALIALVAKAEGAV